MRGTAADKGVIRGKTKGSFVNLDGVYVTWIISYPVPIPVTSNRAPMPRTSRASAAGYCYHALNRGNARATVFRKQRDYEAFLEMMAEAPLRVPMRVVAYCLMPKASGGR